MVFWLNLPDLSFCQIIIYIMQGIYTILLLVVANIFMTFAWYGHLKLQEMGKISTLPLIIVILFSWFLALFEYIFQVPANRIGYIGNGGSFSLMQLKIIQEIITLIVFSVFLIGIVLASQVDITETTL